MAGTDFAKKLQETLPFDVQITDIIAEYARELRLLRCVEPRGDDAQRFQAPKAVAVGGKGLCVADEKHVSVVSLDGTFLHGLRQRSRGELVLKPAGVAVDGSGAIYVSDANQHIVLVFDEEGVFAAKIGSKRGERPGMFKWPLGMCVCAKTNQLFVADSGNWYEHETCTPYIVMHHTGASKCSHAASPSHRLCANSALTQRPATITARVRSR